MISLYKLVNTTPKEVRDRARDVTAVINAVTMGKKMSGKVEIATIVFTGKGRAKTDEQWYELSIELYPTEIHQNIFSKVSANNMAWVKCSCPYFHFYLKHALYTVDSTSITSKFDKGALAPATQKNPSKLKYLCKHLFQAQSEVLKRAQALATRSNAEKAGIKFGR
jgi:hypothetical protein